MTWQDDLAEAHRDWTRTHLEDAKGRFRPKDKGEDYPVHWLDVEATPEQERDWLRRVEGVVDGLGSQQI